MRVTARVISEGTQGSNFWATPERARELISKGQAKMLNDVPVPAQSGIFMRSPAWPEDRFSTVLAHWVGRTVCILGGGPSLTPEQFEMVRLAREADRVRVVAVNDAYLCAPYADVLYFADSEWWTWQTEGRDKPRIGLSAANVRKRFANFAGEKCSIKNTGMNIDDPQVHMLRNLHGKANRPGLSRDPTMLATGNHSGFQALNLSFLAGARDILLCGFDAKEPAQRKHGEPSHWFGEHPRLEPQGVYPLIRESFRAAQHELADAGLRIVNCAPDSAIVTFPKILLADALKTVQ